MKRAHTKGDTKGVQRNATDDMLLLMPRGVGSTTGVPLPQTVFGSVVLVVDGAAVRRQRLAGHAGSLMVGDPRR
jgi:hypothetical protein